MLDFMGIAVNIIDKYFVKHTMVIGLEIMPGRLNAENIKKAIEDIVNSYDFNKQIVSGIIQFICFSHFKPLFKQASNRMLNKSLLLLL